MVALMLNVLGHLLLGAVLFSIILFFFSLATLLGMLPRFLRSMRGILRGSLILSYRLYHLVLTLLQPWIQQALGIDILTGYARLVMCLVLSLIPGFIILILLVPPLDIVLFILCFIHGLIVDLAWDDIENPGGIRLGVEAK